MIVDAASAVTAVRVDGAPPLALQLGRAAPGGPEGAGFQEMVMSGLHAVNAKVETADALVRQFAIDDSVPIHQVTIALEQARLSVELAMQVRSRLVEAYRELMNMPL